jgi:peptidoglycan hydrolase CwlO-like protein
MNLFGKILIILNLVMSLVFMAWAMVTYTTHKNWREEVERAQASPGQQVGLRIQVQDARNREAQLRAQVQGLEQEIQKLTESRVQEVAKLQTEKDNLERQFNEQRKEHETLVAENRRLTAEIEATQNNATAQLKELEQLRANIAKVQAEKEQNFARAVKLTDELHRTEGEIRLLKNRNQQLGDDLARARGVLAAHDLDEFEPVDGVAPKVDGRVLAVNSEGLVEISLGSDDGIRRGHTLDVFRRGASNNKYIGRIEVITTRPDKAVGKILPEYRKSYIQKEDRVATRLN